MSAQETTADEWAAVIEDSKLILDEDLGPADVAEAFDDVDRKTMAELCAEAPFHVPRDRSTVRLEDFRAARDELEGDHGEDDNPDPAETSGEDLAEMFGDVDMDVNVVDHAADPDAAELVDDDDEVDPDDVEEPAEDPTADRAQPDDPSAMDRDDLEAEVGELRDRVGSLEGQVEKLQEIGNRDVALMRGALQELLGGDVVEDVTDLPDAARQFRAEHDRADQAVREGAVEDGGEGERTKVELATDIAKAEAVRVSKKGIQGGAIDYPDVRDIADRQFNTDLNSTTVYRAFELLEDRWGCFEVKAGGQGPNTKNTQLRCVRDEISQSLLNQLNKETN